MRENQPQKKKPVLISVILLFVILSDIYMIIHMPELYLALAAAALVTLVCSVMALNRWLQWAEAENAFRDEQYENLAKLGKSTYASNQKKIKELDDKMNFIGQMIMPLEKRSNLNQKKIASMFNSLMESYKKVSKVTVGRSKENTEALMNSNDKLLTRMDEFQKAIAEMKEEILAQMGGGDDYGTEFHSLEEGEKELLNKLLGLEDLIKEENHTITEGIQETREELKREAKRLASETASRPVAEAAIETSRPVAETSVEDSLMEDISFEETVEESPKEEPAKKAESPKPDLSDPNKMMTPEDIAALLASTEEATAEEPKEEPVKEEPAKKAESPKPDLSDPNKMMTPEDIAALLASTEEATAEEPKEEPIKEEPTKETESSKPDLSDPNKMMTPEDIAALLASTEEETAEEPKEEPVKEEPAKKAESSKPDLSDPNKMMTPEDIAALLASTEEATADAVTVDTLSDDDMFVDTLPDEDTVVVDTLPDEDTVVVDTLPDEDTVVVDTLPDEDTVVVDTLPDEDTVVVDTLPDDDTVIVDTLPDDDAVIVDTLPDGVSANEPAAAKKDGVTPDTSFAGGGQQAEKPPMPDLSDPGKMMSPEDIAALISNVMLEDLPEKAEPIVEEEKPPMPDLSDPNKMMSPEDIAALIANM